MKREDYLKAAALADAEVNRCGLDTKAGREAQELKNKLLGAAGWLQATSCVWEHEEKKEAKQ